MELENRKKILHKHEQFPDWSACKVAKSLNLPRRTVSTVIKRHNEQLTIERAKHKGRKHGNRDLKLRQKVLRSVAQNPGLSDGDRAKRFGTSRSTARRIRIQGGYRCYHAIKHPNRTDKQSKTAKTRSRQLYQKVLTKFHGCIIMDDETYVKMDFKQIPGQKFYVSKKRASVPSKFKYVQLYKFAKKVMIWQAICSCGLKSSPFLTTSTMTSEVYMQECLKKRLLPLIRKHNRSVKFWPDLASCYYSKIVLQWYKQNKVDVIPKTMNPPNCPEFRPIERYWSIVKRNLKKSGGKVQDIKGMRSKWVQSSLKVTPEVVQNLMGSITRIVRDFLRGNEV